MPDTAAGAPARRVYTDQDMYKIHSRWLGPPGWTLPFAVPFRAIPVFAAAFVAGLALLRAAGASGLWLYLLTGLLAWAVSAMVIRFTGPDRSVTALAAIFVHEVGAPRPARLARWEGTVRPGQIPVHPGPSHPGAQNRPDGQRR